MIPRGLIFSVVLMLLKGVLPGLRAAAAKSSNPLDDALVKILDVLTSEFDKGVFNAFINPPPEKGA